MKKDLIREAAIAARTLEDVFIIDFHGHVGPWRGYYCPDVSAAATLRIMDRIGINIAVQFSNAGMGSDHVLGNKLVKEFTDPHLDRMLPFVFSNPRYPDEALEEVKHYCGELGWKGIKIHPSGNGYPVNGPLYAPIWSHAEEHGIPVISHSWGGSVCGSGQFGEVAARYPDATIVLAHACMPDFEGAVQVAKKHDNIFLELTAAACMNGLLEWMVEQLGAERLVYGSDLGGWFSPLHGIGPVLYADIPESDKRKILGGNAARILALTHT